VSGRAGDADREAGDGAPPGATPDPRLRQELFGVEFQSPVLLASGTCGYGEEYDGLVPLDDIGGLVTKAVSVEPRAGNPPHRVAETPGGMINAIGLDNVGLEAFRADKLPWLRENLERARVFVNVVGRTVDEYAAVVAGLDGEEGFLGYEINVSCPNVEGGTLFGTDREALPRLVGRLREETDRPLVVKLTPNVPDVTVYARICEEHGADGLSTINTFPGMLVDVEEREPVIGNVTGGVSGPAILPMGVYLTWRAAGAVDLPVMGIGGIRSAEDALQYVLAGASLVQVGTSLFVDPDAARSVHEGVGEHLDRQGVDRLSELVGALEAGPAPDGAETGASPGAPAGEAGARG
jgi:dihydroorotate dehydrogenase (NAD+) catalytic subunit